MTSDHIMSINKEGILYNSFIGARYKHVLCREKIFKGQTHTSVIIIWVTYE